MIRQSYGAKNHREEALEKLKQIICHDRSDKYGQPENSFGDIAKLWEAYLDHPITASDVAIMMGLLKIARIKGGAGGDDSYLDLAGYAICGLEVSKMVDKT
jgi:hypothetical protein